MGAVHDWIRGKLLRRLGLEDFAHDGNLEDLLETQWSERFEQLRANRMAVSFFRYGDMRRPGRPTYDHVGYAAKHLASYLEDGNQEHLVDAANLMMIEFVRPCCHPCPHLTQSDGQSYERKF